MKNIDVSIIIVNYNTKDFLKKCLESIMQNVSKELTYEVIVVDNASTDGTSDEIKNIHSNLKHFYYIQSKENLGFSKGNNMGIKQAKGKYLLFLNPDTLVKSAVIEGIAAFMDKNPKAGAATCKLEMLNGQIDYAIHRGFPTPWNAFCYFSGLGKIFPRSKLFTGYTQGWKDLNKTHEVDAIAGAFMMVRREAGDEVGWWDEDYFFNGEDLDFCYMLKQKGWKIYYVPEYTMLHYNGVSGGIKDTIQTISTATNDTKIRVTKMRFEAMKLFYNKHYIKQYPKFVTKLVMLGINYKMLRNIRKYQ